MCVIADDSGPLGFGGIMGGETTGCTEATVNVLIESAYFDPVRTAQTGRKAGLTTDARYRFERGVDPAFVEGGLDLATDMIMKLCGGTPTKMKIAGKEPILDRTVDFDFARIEKLSGVKLTDAEIKSHPAKPSASRSRARRTQRRCRSRRWRPDVHGAADLVEEVVRIAGLDAIPSTPLPRNGGVAKPVLTERQKRARRARRALAARGLVEAVTWSFITRKEAQAFGGGADALELANPISTEMSSMRPSLAGGPARERHAQPQSRLQRSGAVRSRSGLSRRQGGRSVSLRSRRARGLGAACGSGRHWSGKAAEAGVFDVKADVFAALAALGFDATQGADHARCAGLVSSGTLGHAAAWTQGGAGPLRRAASRDAEKRSTRKRPLAAFEIFLDALPAEKKKSRAKPPLAAADLLPVTRDFAFVCRRDVPAGDVIKAAAGADKALVQAVNVFDVFEGGSLAAEGKKSIAIEVTLQPTATTLTDKDIEAISAKIVADVKKATGGEIRA